LSALAYLFILTIYLEAKKLLVREFSLRDSMRMKSSHYKTRGLYGFEYWTYSLPKRVGPDMAIELTESALPVGMQKEKRIGLIDEIMPFGVRGADQSRRQGSSQSRRITTVFVRKDQSKRNG
jgi:hypothetical protein